MRPRLMFGFVGVLVLALPSIAAAQRGGSGGFAAGGHVTAVSAGAPHPASVVRKASGAPTAVPIGNSAVRTRATIHSADVPSRHAGLSSPALRNPNTGNRVFAPIGTPLGGRRNPLPVATPRVVYLLGVGGYYYAAPGDAAVDQAQAGVEQESQQGDDQQATADNAGDGEREGERGDNRDGGRNEGSAAARAPEQHEAAAEVEEQEPLPDVGTLTLVLRDGSHLDVVAFTMTQGQVVYITPEGRRLTISAEIFDADATQRVNQERGTPMQLPL